MEELFPIRRQRPLQGAFLDLDLRAQTTRGPRIVANFLSSLDGKIACEEEGRLRVPKAIANARDWRLFQELAAQADVVLVASRLVRECAEGVAQAPPPVDVTAHPDLADWRRARGLAPQPALWILASGQAPIPAEVLRAWKAERALSVLAPAPPPGVEEGDWLCCPDMQALSGLLRAHGVQLAYFAAGGRLFRRLLAAGLGDELFLTIRLQVLAGERFSTLAEGEGLMPPKGFALKGLWHDAEGGQIFLRLGRV